jgi:hypothetical protein
MASHLFLGKIHPVLMASRDSRRPLADTRIRTVRRQHLGHSHAVHSSGSRYPGVAPVRRHALCHSVRLGRRALGIRTKGRRSVLWQGVWVLELDGRAHSTRLSLCRAL